MAPIGGLALLVKLPFDKESRMQVSRALSDERVALGGSYYAWFEHVLDRLK